MVVVRKEDVIALATLPRIDIHVVIYAGVGASSAYRDSRFGSSVVCHPLTLVFLGILACDFVV